MEAWLTREANTLQKYRLVRDESLKKRHSLFSSTYKSQNSLLFECAGPSREAPENTAAVEEAADHHSR